MPVADIPRVSVVVPVYNQADLLPRTVPALLAQDCPAELIWVDDGSTDESAEVIARLTRGISHAVLLSHSSNEGRSAARNTGLASASGDVVLFLDADIVAEPGVVRAHAERHRQPGVLGVLSWDDPLDLDASAPFHRYLLTVAGPRDRPVDDPLSLKYCIIGYTSIRAAALRAVGGFDEEIGYGEDLDLAYRLSRLGQGDFFIEPHAVVHQLGIGDLDERQAKLRAFGANLRRAAAKHPELLHEAELGFVASPLWSMAALGAPLARRLLDHAPGFVQIPIVRYLLASAVMAGYSQASH